MHESNPMGKIGDGKIFSKNSPGTTVYIYMKKKKVNFFLSPYIKIDSKWIIDKNMKAKTMKQALSASGNCVTFLKLKWNFVCCLCRFNLFLTFRKKLH